jgi:hypothetical protein
MAGSGAGEPGVWALAPAGRITARHRKIRSHGCRLIVRSSIRIGGARFKVQVQGSEFRVEWLAVIIDY